MTNFVCIIPSDFKLKNNSASRNGEENCKTDFDTEEVSTPKEEMSSSVMGVGRAQSTLAAIPDSTECLCYRPCRLVLCRNCGFKSLGRVRYICTKHPETSFLHDWPQCPYCRGYCLNEY